MGPEPLLTWGVLGSGERGHGIGKVKVSSNAKLALHCGRIGRRGCQEGFFTGFLINSRQIRVNQGIKKLHYELSVVWDLCLLWVMGEKKKKKKKIGSFLPPSLSRRALPQNSL